MNALRILVASLAAALALASCGGGSDPSTPVEAQRQAQAEARAEARTHNAEVIEEYRRRQAAAEPTENEQEAGETVAGFYAILAADRSTAPNRTEIDAGSFCELLSEQAQAQTIRYARASSGIRHEWDCESAVNLLVLRSKRSGAFGDVRQARVVGVNAEGERATATVQFGNGATTSIAMVREDGAWKLAATSVSPPR